ncbi:MAG: hypothetical protein E7262_08580 [Lachnospiraceae bacterium]|nr:hypothetical protein [Lachnospiraceae bacterium]
MNRSKKTLFELIGGIVTLTLLELAIVTIVNMSMDKVWISNTLGLWLGGFIGVLIAIGIVFHMYNTIDKALDYDKDNAEKYMRRSAILRMTVLFTIIVLLVCFFWKYINMYMLFLSIMNLKFAAYMVPLIDKKINE